MLFDAPHKPYLLTIIQQIAMHLLAACNGDLEAARKSASDAFGCYKPETELELRLAARVIGFSLQANEALAQAADPGMPLLHQIRLRSGAVSLSREADKAERRLQKLQAARRQGIPEAPQVQPEPGLPSIKPAAPRVEQPAAPVAAPGTVAAYAKAHGVSFTEAMKLRQRDQKLAARMMKDAERAAAAWASAMGQPKAGADAALASG
jgi:hypothetical protein